jgi:hypothetical protein
MVSSSLDRGKSGGRPITDGLLLRLRNFTTALVPVAPDFSIAAGTVTFKCKVCNLDVDLVWDDVAPLEQRLVRPTTNAER